MLKSLFRSVRLGHVVLLALVLLSVSIEDTTAMVVSPASDNIGSSSSEKSPSSEVDAAYDLALAERFEEIRNLMGQANLDMLPLDEQNGFDYDGNAARNHLSERHIGKDTKVSY